MKKCLFVITLALALAGIGLVVIDNPPPVYGQSAMQQVLISLPHGGSAGIALVSHGCTASVNNTSAVVTLNTTGANLIVAGLSFLNTVGSPTITDSVGGNSNSFTALAKQNTSGVAVRIIYSLLPSHVGASHAFTVSTASSYPNLCVAAFSGAVGTFDTNTQSGNDSSVSSLQPGSITPGANNEVLVTFFGDNNDDTSSWSINSSFIKLDYSASVSSAAFAGGMAYLLQASAAAVNPTWSFTANNMVAAQMAAFK